MQSGSVDAHQPDLVDLNVHHNPITREQPVLFNTQKTGNYQNISHLFQPTQVKCEFIQTSPEKLYGLLATWRGVDFDSFLALTSALQSRSSRTTCRFGKIPYKYSF